MERKQLTVRTAPYISDQKIPLEESPAFEEFEDYKNTLSLTPTGPDLTVRIPPGLMPSEEQAMRYFEIFFTEIHPYLPIINKAYFYQQWRTNRDSISPLILEGIFSCAGRMSDDPSQGTKWLYIAGSKSPTGIPLLFPSTFQVLSNKVSRTRRLLQRRSPFEHDTSNALDS
jgi:hypothetical protein